MRTNNSAYQQQGQMIINMKTTVTTSGGQHNGLVIHSAIQSNTPNSSSSSSWMSPYSEPLSNRRLEDRIEMLRSNTSLHQPATSPLPIQMVPSTSRESLASRVQRPPSPPPSPIYSFKGRDSPPDEFIQPAKLVLNIFRPPPAPVLNHETSWQVPISRSQVVDTQSDGISLSSKKPALLNDAVTTTTTVEVFRAPVHDSRDVNKPPQVAIPPSPFGGQPLLVRTYGPGYETWNQSKTQVLSDTGSQKGVQWKEGLVEGGRYLDRDSDDYDEIPPLPHPDTIGRSRYISPNIIHNDYRTKSQQNYQPITHAILSNSREDVYRMPPPDYPAPTSPLYIVPNRKHPSNSRNNSRLSNYYPERERRSKSHDNHRSTRHRSMSPSRHHQRQEPSPQEFVIASVSRSAANSPYGSTLMLASPDPNELPGRPASARSHEIFALYQTRDAYNRVVDQL